MTRPPVPMANLPGPSVEKRCASMGTLFLVVSIVELASCAWSLMTPLVNRPMLDFQRGMLSGARSPAPMGAVLGAAQELMSRIALWEALRAVPFAVTAALLLRIALRLRKGDASALLTAQRWVPWAFGAVAVSLLIQALVTVPATLVYQQKVMDAMPVPSAEGAAAPPFDVKQMMSAVAKVSVLFGAVMGGLFWAAWPTTLYFWSRKILRDTPATPA